ncbi:autotransporter assembly complex family protein [uncultured Actinobacillus sp.]|uniref:autotransporter assembly complex protein TamA n=1 Tax=uncultured Actinobacillus sp. TaxID=417616 RepID=UPI0025E65960|nr:autotransporter assembly complex family protein [uncultured Actinobacillus sp.]
MNFKLRLLTLSCLMAFTQISQAEQSSTSSESSSDGTEESTSTEVEQNSDAKVEAQVDLEVKGIEDKDAWNNVKIYLGQVANDYADGSERHQYLVQTAVDKGLRAKGYYNTQYHFSLVPREGEKPLLLLNVDLDREKVKIDEVDIQLQGEAKTDEAFEILLKDVPHKGEDLSHQNYDSFKSNLEGLAFKKGYFDGNWLYHRLEIYPKDHAADWRLGYDSGIRYRYGEIRFTDSQIKEEYLLNILKIKTGEPYYANDISVLTSDYSSSNWFSSVMVEPSLNEEQKIVDLNVLFQPKKKNDVEIGIGFATDDGPRLQFNWKKPWLNSRGHSFESRTYLSSKEQTAEFGYNIPLKSDPLHYYYQISGSLEHEDQNDTKSTAATLGFQRFWTHETGWSFSAGIKARYDSFTQADFTGKTLLIYPTASLNRTRSDGNRFPLWGDSQKLTVNWGTKAIGSDVNFYSWKASSTWVRTYFDNHRFVVRGELGYIHASEFERIPPALRYFAGGDMSVRGFGYKDISPRDPVSGKLVGGSHLATATAEYQYQVYPNWWAAAFYDTGLASDKFKAKDLHSGAGLGVRWASPIGSIKFDIATPVKSPNNDTGVQFYIGLGSEL